MSVLGTTKHSSCNQWIDTWHYSYIVLYCKADATIINADNTILEANSAITGDDSSILKADNAILKVDSSILKADSDILQAVYYPHRTAITASV